MNLTGNKSLQSVGRATISLFLQKYSLEGQKRPSAPATNTLWMLFLHPTTVYSYNSNILAFHCP